MPDTMEILTQQVDELEKKMERIDELEAQLDLYAAVIEDQRVRIDELESQLEEAEDLADDADELSDEASDLIDQYEEELEEALRPSSRRPPPHFKLPDERQAATHHFQIGMSNLGEGYLTVGFYPDSDEIGEVFVKMAKHGEDEIDSDGTLTTEELLKKQDELQSLVSDLSAFLRGVLDQLAISVSIGLQRGIPLQTYARKYRGTRFPPYGFTHNRDIPQATSIIDYIFRYLGMRYIGTAEWKNNR